ncbi:MAG TPA: FAD:protein FMN transferase [Novosphingobium sp.]|nr:FAD:protein FMN transferase [Novosphingobium sp.]
MASLPAAAPAAARIALPARIDAAAVQAPPAAGTLHRLRGETMGTLWRATLAAPGMAPAALEGLITRRLAGIVDEMSHWQADSCLGRFNRLPAGGWMALPADFARVMAAALALAEASGGAFSPALGRLVDLWGFGPPGPVPAPPAAQPLARAHADADWRRLAFEPAPARLRQPGRLALDLSAIAKGFAVDALAEALVGAGIAHFAVEVGGEWRGSGVQPGGQPWWVDLETPPGAALAPLRIALHGLSVATSGTYLRGDHNLDPRSGRPAAGGIVSCSVVHASAMIADGWASALTVLGPEAGLEMANRQGLAARLVLRGGAEVISTPLRALLAD